MKAKNLIITFIFSFFILISAVGAKESLICNETKVELGNSITCTYTMDEEDRYITIDSNFFTIDSISGNNNTQLNSHQALFKSSGKIQFTAKKIGKTEIYVSAEDSATPSSGLVQVIEVIAKTTTTSTTKAKSDNNYLASITIDGVKLKDFSKTKTKYLVEVENEVLNPNIKVETEDENSKVEIDGPDVLAVGDNEYTITVTSENNTTKIYKIIITRKDIPKSSDTSVKDIIVKGYNLNFDRNSKTFYLTINKKDVKINIDVVTTNDKATYEIEGNSNLEDGSIIKIVVTSEDGSIDNYRIIIEKQKTNYIPYIIFGSILLLIVVIILVIKANKKKNNSRPIKNNDINNVKTKEMPVIEEITNVEDTNMDDNTNITIVDNDESEETKILSYVEREELEKTKVLENVDIDKAIDEELDKALEFGNDYDE